MNREQQLEFALQSLIDNVSWWCEATREDGGFCGAAVAAILVSDPDGDVDLFCADHADPNEVVWIHQPEKVAQ